MLSTLVIMLLLSSLLGLALVLAVSKLRPCPYKFTRQKSVGPYILDFYCASAQLAVEIDGSQHYEPQGQQQDAARTAYLQAFGIFVLRFSNRDVLLNLEGVAAEIERTILMRISK